MKATRYEYKGFLIDLRNPKDGLWAILDGGLRMNKKTKEWDYEPLPSSRTDEWIADHCFTLQEAQILIDEVTNGLPPTSKEVGIRPTIL